ncbi:MAG: zinc ribbon domain-containing protein, partial [Candidatus Thermoplasmatota archaeon]|nr:zinc ribbon domain-containing protein [Candidatus Thermoplasmatota archaeon]
IRYGWSPTSKMPSKYVHLASKDLDDRIKVITGFKEPEKAEKSKLITILCWNCNEENVPTNKFCAKCGTNLKPKKEEITMTATDTGIATQEMLKDPEFREFYNDMLALTWEKYKQIKEKK